MPASIIRPAGLPVWRGIVRRFLPCALAALIACPALGDAPPTRPEYEVKAAYLLNFTRYVKWPVTAFDRPDAPIVTCILGVDPFGESIDTIMRGRSSHGRRLVVHRLRDVSEIEGCHVLFVNLDAAGRRVALSEARGKPILTVGEGRKLTREGAAIALVIKYETVQFRVNLDATAPGRLELSSRMLNLAEEVLTSERVGRGAE